MVESWVAFTKVNMGKTLTAGLILPLKIGHAFPRSALQAGSPELGLQTYNREGHLSSRWQVCSLA